MVELFRNPRINWIEAKKMFIGITIFLMLLGALSVTVRMPYRLPATLGAKVTLMMQEAPAGRVEGVMGQGLEVVV